MLAVPSTDRVINDERTGSGVTVSDLFEDLRVLVSGRERGIRVEVSGDVDLASVDVLREVLDAAVLSGSGDVEVDMSRTTFCDSVGLSALVWARRQMRHDGRRLRIVNASRPVLRLLELTGTGDLLAARSFRTPEAPSAFDSAADAG